MTTVDAELRIERTDGRVLVYATVDGKDDPKISMTPEDAEEYALDLLHAAFNVSELERQLGEARTFLASIASAKAQRTVAQSKWMIEQAREGLRRAGGYDFDAAEQQTP